MWSLIVDHGDLASACGGAFDRRVANVSSQTVTNEVTHDDRMQAKPNGCAPTNQRLHGLAAIADHDRLLVYKELPQKVLAPLVADECTGGVDVSLGHLTGDDLALPLWVQ